MRFSLFKKKRPQNEAVIDLGRINAIQQKHKAAQTEQSTQPVKPSEIKFSPGYDYPSEAPAASAASSQNGANDMGFLASLASAASSHEPAEQETSYSSPGAMDIDRLERLNRRIDRFLERLELIERKMERVESRLDIRRY